MIKVFCVGHDYEYEIKELLKLFFPIEEIEIILNRKEINPSDFPMEEGLVSKVSHIHGEVMVETTYIRDANKLSHLERKRPVNTTSLALKKLEKKMIKRGIYQILKEQLGTYLPWGILTGIRPTKIVHELLEQGASPTEILNHLQEEYFIDEGKARLLLTVAETEHPYLYPVDEGKISVYISIPFCPTRCVYCSFPSNPIKAWGHLQQQYVDVLCEEIKETAIYLRESGKMIESLYIGGGTPSTLTIPQLKQLSHSIHENLPLEGLKEYTFEAGRPDTIDREKLMEIKKMGVTRLSINPQTMNDCTLQAIGRSHSVEELKEAYNLAKEIGFENINMDLIIGLPGEDSSMVEHTMREIEALTPMNLTVHTLAVKNASKLKENQGSFQLGENDEILKMLDITQAYANRMGLKPYYMYRQKHMLGHLENIGYCQPGYEGIYNIQIMEEKQTIIAFGAGAVSKFVYPKENRLERVPNVKNLEQYLQRGFEMAERKIKYL